MATDEQSALDIVKKLASRADYGFSIGTFGASGEFIRDASEAAEEHEGDGFYSIATAKGGLKIGRGEGLRLIAFDTLSSDGESWSQALVACLPYAEEAPETIRNLGIDAEAIRRDDRAEQLFDLGVGKGLVRMCIRTRDDELIAALYRAEGQSLMQAEDPGLMGQILASQPVRVMLSPFARIEVYQNIPNADGASPEGPHTHLLPQLLNRRRIHSSNTPIPDGLQGVLNCHPPSPWRDGLGNRIAFDASRNAEFEDLLARFGLQNDLGTRETVTRAVQAGISPDQFAEPATRRERAQMRITLRRLAADPVGNMKQLARWRAEFDRTSVDADIEEALA